MTAHQTRDYSLAPEGWRERFLAALSEVPVIQHACEAAGIERTTVWRLRKADADFEAQVQDAMEAGLDRAEHEAFRRAVSGYEEPVIDKGRLAYRYERYVEEGAEKFRPLLDAQGQPVPLTVRKHSDMLMTLILRGRRKQLYAERIEQTGAGGGPVIIDSAKRASRLAALVGSAQARRDAEGAVGDLV